VSYEWQFIYRLHTTDVIRRQKSKVTILHILNTQVAFDIVFGDVSKKKKLYYIHNIYVGHYPPYLVISDQDYRAADRLSLSSTNVYTRLMVIRAYVDSIRNTGKSKMSWPTTV
jgi:hypothetical protein